jgi:iron(III) transport system substrate-binding protein
VPRLLALLPLVFACRIELGPPGGDPGATPSDDPTISGEVWVYTSMYQSVIDDLTPRLAAVHPQLEIKWFQAGSEKVAQRAEAEWSAGGTRACLLMTSDPFWYADLKLQGRLQPHLPPTALRVDRSLVDPDGAWLTSRISLMVMARNETRVDAVDAPGRLSDLTAPEWRDRFSMGDPLSSGTMFTTVAFLRDAHGWELLEHLRDNGLIAAGGNSSVITRIETGEREIGVVLLENLLMASTKNSPAKPIFPADGAVAIPGPIALTADCPNPRGARAVYDFIMSDEGQRAIVDGNMYAALPELPPPAGAPSLADIAVRPWRPGFLDEIRLARGDIKERWAQLVAGR